jgi:hypothetical protein
VKTRGENLRSRKILQLRKQPSHLVLLIAFISAAFVYIFFLEPWGHDTWYHLLRLIDIEQHLGRGELRAVFSDNAAQGKGLPVWIYYSQWVYWPAIVLTSLGASPLVALKVIYGIFLLVCAVGLYRLLKLHTDQETAAFGALLFVTSNYVIGEIFTRSAYAEFLGVALLPSLLLCLHRTMVNGDRLAAMALVAFSALMILFHPLSFMNAGWALLAYASYIGFAWRIPYRQFLRLLPLFALAFGLSAFYLLPAVIEMRYVLGANGVPTPVQETFLTIMKYLNFAAADNLGFVLDVLGAAVLLSLLLRRHAPERRGARSPWPLFAGIAIYIFLTMRVSEPLYNNIPFLAANLWVSRVLFPLTLLVVIFIADNLSALPDRLRSRTMLGAVAIIALVQGATFVVWRTVDAFSVSAMSRPEIEAKLVEDTLMVDGFGVAEYLPDSRHVPRPPDDCDVVRRVTPEWRDRMTRFEIAATDAEACIHIPRYWHARYAAQIAGTPVPVYGNPDGEILIVPAGRYGEATLNVAHPPYVRYATLLSAVAAAIFLVGLAWSIASKLRGSWSIRAIHESGDEPGL